MSDSRRAQKGKLGSAKANASPAKVPSATDASISSPKPEEQSEPLVENMALDCVINNDLNRLIKCFDDNADSYHAVIGSMINARSSEDGKSPLELAALLGRTEMATELMKRGADANSTNSKGYNALHVAAAWGKLDILKLLVTQGVNVHAATCNNERACDIAKRYDQESCAEYLELADRKDLLKAAIMALKEQMTPEKIKLLTKEERASITALINEKLDWLEKNANPTADDVVKQKELFDAAANPILKKLNEPPPERTKPEKK